MLRAVSLPTPRILIPMSDAQTYHTATITLSSTIKIVEIQARINHQKIYQLDKNGIFELFVSEGERISGSRDFILFCTFKKEF